MFISSQYRGLGDTASDLSALVPGTDLTGNPSAVPASAVTLSAGTDNPVDYLNALGVASNLIPNPGAVPAVTPPAPTSSINWMGVGVGIAAFGLVLLVAPRGRR